MAAFLTACAGSSMSTEEIIGLTKAMVAIGEKLKWKQKVVADKHCIGGLPGNRTTPIVVAICAEAGLLIPKTSSRAITSPSGTADTMEVFTNVNISTEQLTTVLLQENACLSWGGAINLSPADDILIRVERSIDLDSEGQMIASILSKKVAAGSTHVLIDIPVGKDQKVVSFDDAEILKGRFELVGLALGLKIKVVITEGEQPIGQGIGPVLEGMDILKVLKNEQDAPSDLKEKSLLLAAELLLLADKKYDNIEMAKNTAKTILNSGKAYEKFKKICLAQGKYLEPNTYGIFKETVYAENTGLVKLIHSTRLAKIAKLAGAPQDAEAGVFMHKKLQEKVRKGDALYTVYANSRGELEYALDYAKIHNHIYLIQ